MLIGVSKNALTNYFVRRRLKIVKRTVAFLICILAGIGIGWYFGYSRPVAENQRELLQQNQYIKEHFHEFDLDVADFKKRESEISVAAKPWEASTASIALIGLKDLDTNNMEDAKFRFAELVGFYYRGHLHGDTNLLLTDIETFAAKDSVLLNEIYGKLQ